VAVGIAVIRLFLLAICVCESSVSLVVASDLVIEIGQIDRLRPV
jgi:hypothetical protein